MKNPIFNFVMYNLNFPAVYRPFERSNINRGKRTNFIPPPPLATPTPPPFNYYLILSKELLQKKKVLIFGTMRTEPILPHPSTL